MIESFRAPRNSGQVWTCFMVFSALLSFNLDKFCDLGGCHFYKQEASSDEVMTEVEFNSSLEDFANTGRSGRRNAMPDVLDPVKTAVGTGNLPFDLEKLHCSDPEEGKSNTACAAPNSSSSENTNNPSGS
ncbi:hypothetical protein LOTGIDRAFT_171872 [Lottia gigantea]|uniref:Uncharacterized protein n=1 Tax=Lottia gigantea TaxID=225164 RepID=V4BA38_LOTGI|nr:hypothetical protein LOTGIDRAFT_171872 [Lottia gigantea]ESP02672.1 hypothetical protein LOTGIDRAFT_171872 [Lottia gigantea]